MKLATYVALLVAASPAQASSLESLLSDANRQVKSGQIAQACQTIKLAVEASNKIGHGPGTELGDSLRENEINYCSLAKTITVKQKKLECMTLEAMRGDRLSDAGYGTGSALSKKVIVAFYDYTAHQKGCLLSPVYIPPDSY
jgi:hypothetical protein